MTRYFPSILSILILCSAGADERILSYHSQVQVHTNNTLTVTETIRVRSEQNQIKRGIYRQFPTKYKSKGGRVTVRFEVLSVKRDGTKEPYHIKPMSNGQRLYIGREDKILPKGVYSYEITYHTNRQIGFFREHDELYWNVTGNDWAFPMEEVSCRVTLPVQTELNAVQLEAYTGRKRSSGQDFEASYSGTVSRFNTTRTLKAREGLTIVVSFPKGIVHEPGNVEKMQALLAENPSTFAASLGLLLVGSYLFIAWFLVGRDPSRGTIIPRFEPPPGISPGAARYVMHMGYDDRCFAAALITLCVKGWATLKLTDKGFGADEYTIVQNDESGEKLSTGEQTIFLRLLRKRKSLRLVQAHHATIGSAVTALKKALKNEYAQSHFQRNRKYLVPAGIGTVLTLLSVTLLAHDPGTAGFMSLWLSGWTVGVVALVVAIFSGWKNAGTSIKGAVGAIFITLFAVPFFIGELVGIFMYARATSPIAGLCLVSLVVLIGVYHHLLKAPTRAGRKVMDELEGFKLYLSVAEQDRLHLMHPPEETPELFERYLPYALALGVEQEWSERFASVLALAEAGSQGASTYHPAWYSSNLGQGITPGALAGAVGGALTGTISSSSHAPGSSSGGGGGGSSGGGGGGGGGGGW